MDHRGRGDLRLRGEDRQLRSVAPLRSDRLDYCLNFIPFFINQFSGLFTFIAVIFFTEVFYQTEIVAMLSGGMSFRRLMWPYFLGALIIVQLWELNLWLIPVSPGAATAFESNRHPAQRRVSMIKISTVRSNPIAFAYIRNYSRNRTRLRSSAWKSTNRER
ncbi:MAG: LptF/LptG family permease [Alistipes putredinis]